MNKLISTSFRILPGLLILFAACSESSGSAFEKVFPWLSGVHLGMTADSLITVRPNVNSFDLDEPDPRKSLARGKKILLLERFPDSVVMDNAVYSVRDSVLQYVVLSRTDSGNEIDEHLKLVLGKSIKTFGKDYTKAISRQNHDNRTYEAPVLIWNIPGGRLSLTFTPRSQRKKDSVSMILFKAVLDSAKSDRIRKPAKGEEGLFEP